MKSLLDEVKRLAACGDQRALAERGIGFIRRMMKDDERFADCVTFDDYLRKAADFADVKNDATA